MDDFSSCFSGRTKSSNKRLDLQKPKIDVDGQNNLDFVFRHSLQDLEILVGCLVEKFYESERVQFFCLESYGALLQLWEFKTAVESLPAEFGKTSRSWSWGWEFVRGNLILVDF